MSSGHTYKIVVINNGLYRPTLDIDVMSNIYDPPAHLYTIPLTDLTPVELSLDQGRFLHYDSECLGIVVSYDVTTFIKDHFEERLSWITANVYNAWSFALEMPHVSKARVSWTFADANDAVLFKLTF